VVRKKIVAPTVATAKVRPESTVRTAAEKPAAKSQTREVAAKVDRTQAGPKDRPAAKNTNDSRMLIASNEKSKPMQRVQPGQVPVVKPAQGRPPSLEKQKKPAISPKSEITQIKQVAKKPAQSAGRKTVAAVKMNTAQPAAANSPKVLLASNMPSMYDPKGKIDPFEPLVREMPASVKKKKNIKRQPRTPLERIALSQLKLTAIILASSGNRAMVEETSGKGYVVKKGTYIGKNGGKISNINKEIVIVEERFEDYSGKIQTRKRELKLPKPPGEF
jgi:type IV pilus assembly protein PilP